MSLQVTQQKINLRKSLIENSQDYGIKGKQILESETVQEVRSLIGAGRKNLIINGGFDIWQRGTSFNSISTSQIFYYADRLGIDPGNTGDVVNISREIFNENYGSNYYIRFDKTNISGGGAAKFDFKLEDLDNFANKTLTLSLLIKSTSPEVIPVFSYMSFGTGGSPSALVNLQLKNINSTNEWKRYETTFTLDSLDGKTIGTNNDSSLILRLLIPSTINTIDVAQVQLEEGSVATEFEKRSIGEEIELCQRYYQKSYDLETDPGTATINGTIFDIGVRNTTLYMQGAQFSTVMRTAPAVVLYSQIGTIGNITNNGNKVSVATDIATGGFAGVNITSGDTTSAAYHYTAEAEL